MPTPGQPTLYKPEYCELAHNYCLLGATNEVLAGFFGVICRTTLYQGKEHTITNTVSYPPDTQACMFWLRNRQREYWQARPEALLEPEIVDDMAARLDAAGESTHHAGD